MRHKNIFSLILNILRTKSGEDPACVTSRSWDLGLGSGPGAWWVSLLKRPLLVVHISVREKGEKNIGAGPTHHSPSPYTGEWIYFGSHSFSHVYDTNTKFKTKTKIKSPDLQGKRELNNTCDLLVTYSTYPCHIKLNSFQRQLSLVWSVWCVVLVCAPLCNSSTPAGWLPPFMSPVTQWAHCSALRTVLRILWLSQNICISR